MASPSEIYTDPLLDRYLQAYLADDPSAMLAALEAYGSDFSDPWALACMKAKALLDMGNVEEAKEVLGPAAEAGDPGAYCLLGNIAFGQGDAAAGRALYAKARSAGTAPGLLMSNYAVMLDMLGEEKLSIQAQHRAARLDRDNLAMAMLLIRCRRPEEALKLLEADKGGQTGPEHALVQAAALFGLGRSEEALAAIEQAGVSEEDSLSTDLIRLYKISALNQSGHPQEALTMLEGVSPEYRSKELFLIQKALSLAALARQEEAAAVAAQLAQNADSSPNTIYLINLMRDTGLYDQAKALCLCIIDGNSRDMTYYQARYLQADCEFSSLGLDKAKPLFEKLIADCSSEIIRSLRKTYLYLVRAMCHFRIGDYRRAGELCDFLLELEPQDATLLAFKSKVMEAVQ